VILAVDLTLSDRNAAKRAIGALRAVNARILGTVITGLESTRKRYGYHHYYDRYYYYYDSEHSAEKKDRAHRGRTVQ